MTAPTPGRPRRRLLRSLLGVALALTAPALAAQEAPPLRQEPAPRPDLQWRPVVSELPLVDLTGRWRFLPKESDPMVEAWQGAAVRYTIQQLPDRIVLDFGAEGGRSNVQAYRWTGELASFERGDEQVRERAVWTEGGRVLEVDGRRWHEGEPGEVASYRFVYRLDGPDRLVFEQHNDSGTTRWVFVRE